VRVRVRVRAEDWGGALGEVTRGWDSQSPLRWALGALLC